MVDEYPVMDETRQYPVAGVWRPALRAIVEALRSGDYTTLSSIPMVAPIDPRLARRMQKYIEDYGETILTLPETTWSTSVSHWMGEYWDVLVDLWTAESGCSDLCLSLRITKDAPSYSIRIMGVYVP